MISRRALLTSTAIPVLAGFAPTGLLLSGAPSAPSAPPSLDLIFGGPMLDPRLTFTRGSTATYFDANGVMQTSGYNQALQSGNPTTWTLTAATIVGAAIAAPDGTMTGAFLREDTTASSVHLAAMLPATVTNATQYTYSCYAKAGTRTFVGLSGAGLTAAGLVPSFNLLTGVDVSTGTNANFFHGIVPVGSGWYRCWVTWTTTNTSTFQVELHNAAASRNYTGDGASGAYIWGAQIEQSATMSSYSPTTVAANGAPRFDYDPVTHALNGLLIEETRTNSIRNSSTAGAVNGTATLPTNWAILNGGGLTATVVGLGTDANGLQYIDIQLVGTTGGAWRIAFETNTAIAAVQNQVWTSSVYVALVAGSTTGLTGLGTGFMAYTSGGTFIAAHEIANIQPTNAPLVSQRVTVTTTATDATTGFVRQTYAGTVAAVSVNATLRFAFPQLELGAFPTSYIPTTGAAVTRATDVLTIQPASMSPWFNAGPGSWMIAATSYPPVGGPRRLINHLSTTAVYPLWQQTSNNLFSFDGVGNLATVATIIPGVPFSGASTWNTGGAATICLNGGAVNSNASQTTGFASLLTTGVKFFADPPGTSQNTGYIRRVRYWPRVLSNTELQQVTA